jgi:hypothetical protein
LRNEGWSTRTHTTTTLDVANAVAKLGLLMRLG